MDRTQCYEMSAGTVQKAVDGFTEEEFQTRFGTLNPACWIVGHLLLCRRLILPLEGMPFAEDPLSHEMAAFNMGGKPEDITDDFTVQRLTELFQAEHQRFMEVMAHLTPEQLTEPASISQLGSLDEALSFMSWHEAYHMGQLVSIRQALGKASPMGI